MVDMTKRERSESPDRDEDVSITSPKSSESVQSVLDLRDHSHNGSEGMHSSRELDAEDARLSVDLIDPDDVFGIEQELENLGVDEDLKASIRTMTPNTQREVINDIVRTRQVSPLMLGGAQVESPFEGRASGADDARAGMIRNAIEVYDLLGPILSRFDGASAEEGPEAPSAVPEPDLAWNSRQMAMLLARMPLFQEVQQLLTMQQMGLERDVDDMSYEELLALEERIGNVSKGMRSEREINACMRRLPRPPAEGRCPICLDAFKEAENPAPADGGHGLDNGALEAKRDSGAIPAAPRKYVCIKNCGHIFHQSCIKQWFRMDKRCPVCNQEVILTSSES